MNAAVYGLPLGMLHVYHSEEQPTTKLQCAGCACRSYLRTQAVIDRYKDMPSFQGIHSDCQLIVKDLKDKLKLRFRDREV